MENTMIGADPVLVESVLLDAWIAAGIEHPATMAVVGVLADGRWHDQNDLFAVGADDMLIGPLKRNGFVRTWQKRRREPAWLRATPITAQCCPTCRCGSETDEDTER
jgi:hypothetical protein